MYSISRSFGKRKKLSLFLRAHAHCGDQVKSPLSLRTLSITIRLPVSSTLLAISWAVDGVRGQLFNPSHRRCLALLLVIWVRCCDTQYGSPSCQTPPQPRPRQWAFGGGPATTALITPARHQHLPSHASDRCRSWSATPGIWPAVTLAFSARHNGGGSRAGNPHPRSRPRLCCPALPPWRPHRTVGRQVLGNAGEHAPGWERRRPRMGKTLPHIKWR